MTRVKPRVKVPKEASVGEVITIKTLISHPMESGQRRDRSGEVIPRHIINRFVATFNGQAVVDFAIDPAVSANPYFQFEMTVPEAGVMRFEWTDDDGTVFDIEREIKIV